MKLDGKGYETFVKEDVYKRQPLYRLEMGKTGDSCALYIAKRLGMPEDMIQTCLLYTSRCV